MEHAKGNFIFEDEIDIILSTLGASIDVAIDNYEDELKKDPFTNYEKTIDNKLGERGRRPAKKEYTIKEAEEIIMNGNDYNSEYPGGLENGYNTGTMSDDIVSDEDMMNNMCIGEYIDKLMNF